MAVALAAVAVFGFAGRMLAQIKRPAGSTHRLAAGAHSLRVSVSRDELGRLLESFSQLASTLESKDRMRRRFLADISHELRTPLSILQSELEALEDGIRPLTSASVRSLRAEVLTLSALVSDLYDLALADTGALAYRFQDVNVTDLVRSAVDAFRERFSARRLSVEMDWNRDEPLRVKGDPDRLRQLLNNLLENSVRHTHSGGSLRVALTRADGSVQLDFQDSAPNVPPKIAAAPLRALISCRCMARWRRRPRTCVVPEHRRGASRQDRCPLVSPGRFVDQDPSAACETMT